MLPANVVFKRFISWLFSYLFYVGVLLNCVRAIDTQSYCYINPNDSCLQIKACTGQYKQITATKYTCEAGCDAIDVAIKHEQELLSGGIIPYCQMGNQPSKECQLSCGDNGSHTLSCGGVLSYCATHVCDPTYMCFCDMVNITSIDYMMYGGSWNRITSSSVINLGIYSPVITMNSRKLLEDTKALYARSSYPGIPSLGAIIMLKTTVHDGDIIIDIPISPGTLVLRKISSDLVDVRNITQGGEFTYKMSDKDRIISGDVTVDYFYNGNLYASGGVYYNGNHFCRLYNCYTCGEAWSMMKCIPHGMIIWMYLFYAVLTLFVLLLIPLACLGLDTFLLFVLFPMRCFMRCCMVGNSPAGRIWREWIPDLRKYFKPVKGEEVEVVTPLMEEAPTVVSEEETERPKPEKRVKIGNKWYIVKILMFVGLVLGDCTSSSFITATFSDCVNLPNGDQTCNLTTAIQANLLTTGASVCFLVKNGNTTESIQIEVKHAGVIASYDLETLYYTSKWTGSSVSAHRCWNAGNCVQGRCESLEGSGAPIDAYGEIPLSYLMSQPGRSGCRRSCGGGCTGCFFTDPGCVFYRYAILPTGSVYSIRRPINLKVTPYVTVNVSTPNSTFVRTMKVSDPIFDSVMRAFVVGVYDQPVETFAARYVSILASAGVEQPRIVTASPLNQPQPLSIGDIQASSAASLVAANTNAFAYATGLQTASQGATTQGYSWVQPGMNVYENFPSLPSVFSGSVWSYDGTRITSNLTFTSAITVGIELLGGLRITRVRNIVCPVASVITSGGCYQCSNGSAVSVRLRSSCKSGPVNVKIVGGQGQTLLTEFVSVTTVDAEYPVYLFTSVQANSFDMVFSAEGGNATINVQFSAWPGPNVTLNNTVNYSGNQSTGPGSGWDFGWLGSMWDNFIKGSMTTLQQVIFWVVLVIVMIVGIIGLVVGAVIFFFAAKFGLSLLGEFGSVGLIMKSLFGKSEAQKTAERISKTK